MTTDWGLVIAIMGLVTGAFGAAWAVAENNGRLKHEVATQGKELAEQRGKIDAMRGQLSHGDTRFALLNQNVEGVKNTLDEIKEDLEKLVARG